MKHFVCAKFVRVSLLHLTSRHKNCGRNMDLLDIIGSQSKHFIIERSLSSPLNYLIPFSKFKREANIESVHWFEDSVDFEDDRLPITILIHSGLDNVPKLKIWIQRLSGRQIDLVITDDYSRSFQWNLQQQGLIGDINTVTSWKLSIQTPLCDNLRLIHLQLAEFNSLYQYKTPNLASKLVDLLNQELSTQNLYITKIFAKGLNSNKFVQHLKQRMESNLQNMDQLSKSKELKIKNGLFEQLDSGLQCDLMVFERNLDFLSVLLNQLNYMGIIDESLGIDINNVKLDEELVYFNESPIFDKIQQMNFGLACDFLNEQAKSLQSQYDELVKKTKTDISKDIVTQLKDLEDAKNNVALHTRISEFVLQKLDIKNSANFNTLLEFQQDLITQSLSYSNSISTIQEWIYAFDYDAVTVLRLIGIISITFNGLRESDYNKLTNDIVEQYGIKYWSILQKLIKIGIITIRGDPSIIKNYSQLSNSLQLVQQDDSEGDISYRGYTPLVTQVIRKTLNDDKRSNWDDVDLSAIIGKSTEESLINESKQGGASLQVEGSTVIVVMIGGLTYAELASLTHLAKNSKRQFLVITDGVINTSKVINH